MARYQGLHQPLPADGQSVQQAADASSQATAVKRGLGKEKIENPAP